MFYPCSQFDQKIIVTQIVTQVICKVLYVSLLTKYPFK